MSEELTRAATCPINEVNPMHPELLQSPWGMNKRLREEAPVWEAPEWQSRQREGAPVRPLSAGPAT